MPQNEILNLGHEHGKGNMGTQFLYANGNLGTRKVPIWKYGKRENMKLGTWNKVILKSELRIYSSP